MPLPPRTGLPLSAAAGLAGVVLASACPAQGEAPRPATGPATGPTEVSAGRIEYRRFDSDTGRVALRVSAERATASGESAELEGVRLVRYSPGGAAVLEAAAPCGRMLPRRRVALEGDVAVAWRGARAVATFRVRGALWDGAAGVLASDGPVSGTLRGSADAGASSAGALGAEAFGLEVEGRGLTVEPGADRGRIGSDVAAVATGAAGGPWRVTADAGLGFAGFAGDSPALDLAGPVGLDGRGAAARAGSARIDLAADAGRLIVSRAWLVGTVRAMLEGAGPLPWGEGPVEVRAESVEIAPTAAHTVAVASGTEADPARVVHSRGVLRGVRIEFSAGALATDGGATSEMLWEGGR